MSQITFDKQQTDRIVDLIQTYFTDKLDSDIGRFDAEFLLDFFRTEIGSYFYNQAIVDCQTVLQTQFDNMSETLTELEKWTPVDR